MRLKLSGDTRLSLNNHFRYFLLAIGEIIRCLIDQKKIHFFQPKLIDVPLIDEPVSPFRMLQEAFFREMLVPCVPIPAKILDVGCGRGQNYKIFHEHKIKGAFLGVDLGMSDKGALNDNVEDEWKCIIGQTKGESLQCEFRLHSLFSISDLGRKFNCILSCSVLEHVDNPGLAIKELNSVFEQEGIQAHTVPAPFSYFLYGPHGYRRFLPLELNNMFSDRSKEIKIHALGGAFSYFLHLFLVTFPVMVLKKDIRKSIPCLYNKILYCSIQLDRLLPFLHVGYGVVIRQRGN